MKTIDGFLSLVSAKMTSTAGRTWNNALGNLVQASFAKVKIARRTSISSIPSRPGTTYSSGTPGRRGVQTSSGAGSGGNFPPMFALFTFQDPSISPNLLYGWMELSSSVSDGSGPLVTVEGWAYDDSGNPIAAGDTGEGSAPEPSTMAMTSLGALALGATGLRRWRAARKLTA